MRNIPTALATHIAGEVTTLTRCIKITKTDGTVVRLTTHDVAIVVAGDTYSAGIPVDISALQSSDDLSVDNAEITLGIDGTTIVQEDFDSGLYDTAQFELFVVNWANVADGVIYLKRGTFGDIEVTNDLSVKIQLRGLTQALQRPIVDKYSATCRVVLGGKKCGVTNTPNKVRRPNQKVKTWDWFLLPVTTTGITISNASFETGDTDWTSGADSAWVNASAFAPYAGSQYLVTDTGTNGQEMTLYRDFDTATIGMVNGNVDTGDYTFDVSLQVASTVTTGKNPAKVYVEQYNAAGATLRREETEYAVYDYQVWQGIGLTVFVLPGTRTIRVGIVNRLDNGTTGKVAFDAVVARFWAHSLANYSGNSYRSVRIPSFPSDETITTPNPGFELNGTAVANSGTLSISAWTRPASTDFWRVVTSATGFTPETGTYFLQGGDDGLAVPDTVYTLYQDLIFSSNATINAATAANITAGWYWAKFKVRAGKIDSGSDPRLVVEFRDASSVLATLDTGYDTSGSIATWRDMEVSGRVPSGTTKVRIKLIARSGATGAANVVFDGVKMYFMPTAYEHAADEEYGYLSGTLPTYDTTQLNYTEDGEAVVQAMPAVFDFAAVTGTVDTRAFLASSINKTASQLYSGKITWLSGNNAGRSSYIRIWDNTAKSAKLYDDLPGAIQVGDKFVYALGCDKTITRCADTFGNAHNFRGEPYLPGSARVIEFLTAN